MFAAVEALVAPYKSDAVAIKRKLEDKNVSPLLFKNI
jgi:hypothetical protein